MKKLLLALLATFTLAGCQTISDVSSNDLVVQYSVLKVIEESEEISGQDVQDTIGKARKALDADTTVSIDEFKAEVADQIGWAGLAPSDKLLIAAIVDEVQVSLEKQYEVEVLSEEVVYEIERFLDLVEQAARLSGE